MAAFFCEPVIGAGGVHPPPDGYIEGVADLCAEHGVLLVIDSVICGFGRLGTWFGVERWEEVRPDLITFAKGVTSGYLPLGGVIASGAVAAPFFEGPGSPMLRHGATYAGHPTCCAAALTVLDIYERENIIPRGRELERPLADALAPLADHPAVSEIRSGLGLLAAVQLSADAVENEPAAVAKVTQGARDAGVLVRPLLGSIAVSPPLVVEPDHLTQIADALRAGLDRLTVSEPEEDVPELRDGPPWVTEEMVALQPALVRALLDSPPAGVTEVAAAVQAAQRAQEPVTVIGCGTSEHGAMAIAALLEHALGEPAYPPAVASRQSLDAVERPQRGGVCIAVSHDGGTRATTLALEAAARAGAVTALVTARPHGSAAGPAAHVLTTPVHDDSWCHTVAYTSAIATGAAIARELGLEGVDGRGAEALLTAGFASQREAAPLAGAARVVCAGAGIDLITARELALKLAEGARVPTAAAAPRDAAARPPRRRGPRDGRRARAHRWERRPARAPRRARLRRAGRDRHPRRHDPAPRRARGGRAERAARAAARRRGGAPVAHARARARARREPGPDPARGGAVPPGRRRGRRRRRLVASRQP